MGEARREAAPGGGLGGFGETVIFPAGEEPPRDWAQVGTGVLQAHQVLRQTSGCNALHFDLFHSLQEQQHGTGSQAPQSFIR